MRARIPEFKFPSHISKHWLDRSAFKTHLLNSFTLIFPTGEKYFIRSLNRARFRIKDPELRKKIKVFIQQETQHALEHEKFLDNLRSQHYQIEGILRVVNFITRDLLEPRLGVTLNLATTAGLEHFTALLAKVGLETGFLKGAEGEMRELFEWHAAEELEHKAVAYEALQAVDQRYLIRLFGLLMATLTLIPMSAAITANLIYQDQQLFRLKPWDDFFKVMISDQKLFAKGFKVFIQYLNPSFHPEHIDDTSLAHEIFMGLNLEQSV